MAGIAKVYMSGGLAGLIGAGSGKSRAKVPENIQSVTTDRDVEVYKWRDEQGVMHFGEAPPQQDSGVEKIELKARLNVMKAVKAEEEVEEMGSRSDQVMGINPYSPQGVSDLMDQTRDLAKTLNKKQEDQKKMLDNMMQN